jgi:sugar diacid utilization regulator
MEIKDAYREKLSAQLKEWSAQINLMEAKAENIGADMKIKRLEAIHELRAKQHLAAEKMKEMEKYSGDAWDQVKITAEKIWADLKTGVADAQAKFK